MPSGNSTRYRPTPDTWPKVKLQEKGSAGKDTSDHYKLPPLDDFIFYARWSLQRKSLRTPTCSIKGRDAACQLRLIAQNMAGRQPGGCPHLDTGRQLFSSCE
ncbi:hypothetical protein GX48_03802 [Paracoccidioides brasiliensis]|nr:hypothetical protein GX48_03802 [Paracoccidioides brasiliensis]